MPPKFGDLFIDTAHTNTNLIQHEHGPFGVRRAWPRQPSGSAPLVPKIAVQAQKRGDYNTAVGKDITVPAVKGLRLANRNRRPARLSCVKMGDAAMMRPNGSMKPEMPVFAARANAR